MDLDMGIDMFINQLIQSGLADYSCLDLISDHYLKIIEVYEIIQNMNISGDIKYNAQLDKRNDILTVDLILDNEYNGDIDSLINSESYFEVTISKNNNIISIEIYNDKYESEVELYETRFARYKETDNSQWS